MATLWCTQAALLWLFSVSCDRSYANSAVSCRCNRSCMQSVLTVSNHLFSGLPLAILPWTYPNNANFGYLMLFIRRMWPRFSSVVFDSQFPGSEMFFRVYQHSWFCPFVSLLQFSSSSSFRTHLIYFLGLFSWSVFQHYIAAHNNDTHLTFNSLSLKKLEQFLAYLIAQ